jgi:PleD family two-component response regulator
MTRSSLLDDAIIESQFSGAALAQNAKNIDATPTILVADDDDDIRGLITFKLQMAGYRVLTASTVSASAGSSRRCEPLSISR